MEDRLELLVEYAEEKGYILDYTLESLDRFEEFIATIKIDFDHDLFITCARYLGEVVVINFNGKWSLDIEDSNSLYYRKPITKFFNEENRYQDGFYIAEKGETAIAEVVYHGADATKAKIIRFELDKSKLKVLDLTDKKIANDWGLADAKKFEINALKPGNESINKYQKFQEISIKAREEGFNAIKFESARGTGSNYVIYGKETSFFKEALKPQMVMPAN